MKTYRIKHIPSNTFIKYKRGFQSKYFLTSQGTTWKKDPSSHIQKAVGYLNSKLVVIFKNYYIEDFLLVTKTPKSLTKNDINEAYERGYQAGCLDTENKIKELYNL